MIDKKLLFITIGIIILMLLGGTSYWYFKIKPIKETQTEIQATPTTTPSVTLSPSAISPTPTTTTTQPTTTPTGSVRETTVQFYMISIDDNGNSGKMIGCGDSVVSVSRRTVERGAPIEISLRELLAEKNQYDGNLYNALYQSNLTLDSVTNDNGKAIVRLSGTVLTNGSCDDPRFEAQIEETALQFSSVNEVEVLINGINMKDIFDQSGA